MNLLSFRTRLRTMIGNPTVTEVPDAELDERVNDAVKDITDKHAHYKGRKVVTFPTVADINQYVLPTDLVSLMKVIDLDNDVKLRKRDEIWAASRNNLDSGKPTDYIRERDFIQLFPPPDGVYSLKLVYKISAPALALDTDEPVYPDVWDQGTLYLARYKHWDIRGDLQKAMYAWNVWQGWLKTKPSEIAEELFADDTEGVILLIPRGRASARQDFDESL